MVGGLITNQLTALKKKEKNKKKPRLFRLLQILNYSDFLSCNICCFLFFGIVATSSYAGLSSTWGRRGTRCEFLPTPCRLDKPGILATYVYFYDCFL